jgi:hypothetical protein
MVFEDMNDEVKCGYTAEMQALYPTIKEFAENELYCYFDKKKRTYGYWYNEKAFHDWHQIGGRFPFMFLVKENCHSAVLGERSWSTKDTTRVAPSGYKWVAGAKKRDIAWEEMKSHGIAVAKHDFLALENAFRKGSLHDEHIFDKIVENGITSWGVYIYVKGESFEQYLERNDLGAGCKYPVRTHSYLDNGEYFTQGDIGWFGGNAEDMPSSEWQQMTQAFIERVDDDDFIVMVDCHI